MTDTLKLTGLRVSIGLVVAKISKSFHALGMEDSLGTPDVNIQQIRLNYFKELAIEHNLSLEEIQKIHEETLEKLTRTEPKGAMFMNVAFPAAIKNYKENKI